MKIIKLVVILSFTAFIIVVLYWSGFAMLFSYGAGSGGTGSFERYEFKGNVVNVKEVFEKTFDKGYVANWNSEVFIVTKVLQTTPITYKIKDKLGEDIIGSFYTQELSKTAIPDDFK